MPTVVTTASTADFLAVVPHLVGFQPQNSIVFVAFQGRRTCGAMRFDLPDLVESGADATSTVTAKSKTYARVATTLVGMLSKLPGVEGVVPVVYTSEAFDDGPPRAAFVRAVVERFEFSGFDVRDALCVAADGWGSYVDEACPPAGRPLSAIVDSRVLDDLPEHQLRPLGDIATLTALPAVAAADRERVARSVSALSAVIDETTIVTGHVPGNECPGGNELPGGNEWSGGDEWAGSGDGSVSYVPAALERILEGDPREVDPRAAGFVITLARLPALRDVVMLQSAFDTVTGARVLGDARRFVFGASPSDLETAGLMLGRGPRPDPGRVEHSVEVLKRITALAPRSNRPPLFCVLAWLSWALGRSSVAAAFVAEAEKTDADYGFAELMRAVLERGMLPEWAFENGR